MRQGLLHQHLYLEQCGLTNMVAINYKLLNEDGTELLLETGDSILLENYFPSHDIPDSKYAIITTPLPIEKSLQYTLIKSNKIEKGIVYEIKSWPRKILKYCVETTQSIQKGIKYNISRTFIGQLGDNTTTNRYTPTQIGTSDWSSIAAGSSHSLGISIEIIPSSNFFLFFN